MICVNCSEEFPLWVLIDGTRRNLHKRKYCLECLPFKSSKNPLRDIKEGKEVECTGCTKKYIYRRGKGFTTKLCINCIARRKRRKTKEKCIEYKGGKCIRCGYKKCLSALEFHHLDPTQKDFGISTALSHSWVKVKQELDKCILLCRNCHAEEHEKLREI